MLRLHQFQASHFNEKIRWALRYKNLDYERKTYLPGPHYPVIKKLSAGISSTPLLEHDGHYISGSASIIAHLETCFPTPALYPSSAAERREALALQSRFDTLLGPASRTLLFSVMIHSPNYFCLTFSQGKSWVKRIGYRALFPAAKPMIEKANLVYEPEITTAWHTCEEIAEEIAQQVVPTGYLVGDRFSVADLTAASFLALLTNIDHQDMKRIEPVPEALRKFLDGWAGHPAIQWTREMYARHRA